MAADQGIQPPVYDRIVIMTQGEIHAIDIWSRVYFLCDRGTGGVVEAWAERVVWWCGVKAVAWCQVCCGHAFKRPLADAEFSFVREGPFMVSWALESWGQAGCCTSPA